VTLAPFEIPVVLGHSQSYSLKTLLLAQVPEFWHGALEQGLVVSQWTPVKSAPQAQV
jgi:hypothetical protein